LVKHAGGNSGCYTLSSNAQAGTPVRVSRLDEELQGIQVDFVKIDVEGAELAVLQGARNLLEQYKPLVQIEMNGLSQSLHGVAEARIRGFLEGLGYKEFARCNDVFLSID